MTHTAYIGIGTNIEPRLDRMNEAIDRLKLIGELDARSGYYETTPIGYSEQADFLNAVVRLATDLSATELHAALKALELHLGRQHRERWHEREIDFDLLFFDDEVIDTDTLSVPHPELHRRSFVLVPLAEIAPALVHPITRNTIAQSLSDLGGTGDEVHVYSKPD